MPSHKKLTACLLASGAFLLPAAFGQDGDARDQEIERLTRMVLALEDRIAALEAKSDAPAETAAAPAPAEPAPAPGPAQPATPAPEVASAPPTETRSVAFSPSGAERSEETVADTPVEEKESITFGGALRYNFFVNEQNDDTKYGDTGFDLFRISVDGSHENILLSAEYRFYSYMDTLHHGWIGYDFPEAGQLQIGVSQVPFGILPYASHNYWFGAPYYLGLSDDYDLGAKFTRRDGPWHLDFAFYKNEELGNASDLNRYSFDPVNTGDGQANEEANQFNARVAYLLGQGSDSVHEFGFSAQRGELFNSITNDSGDHWAVAAHLDSRYRRWNFQLELARYQYNPRNPLGISDDSVRLGAFATSYDVASEATVGAFNVAYNLPARIPGIDSVLLYNDFSIVRKDQDAWDDSMLNTTGAAIGVGPLFIYLDLIHARNMVFFGNGSLAGEGDTDWKTRFNLNLGYYW